MIKLHKIVGLICVFGSLGLSIIIAVLAFATGDMPTHIFWKSLIALPFVLFYGLKELRKARILEYNEFINKTS